MKVGDKVICKKSMKGFDFIKGNVYYINIIDNNSYYYVSKYRVLPSRAPHGIWLNVNDDSRYICDFDEHFQSKKEIRRLKLNKLNENKKQNVIK